MEEEAAMNVQETSQDLTNAESQSLLKKTIEPPADHFGTTSFNLKENNVLDKTLVRIGLGPYHYFIWLINYFALFASSSTNLLAGLLLGSTLYRQQMGVTPVNMGYILMVNSASSTVFCFAGGYIADLHGRRISLVITLSIVILLGLAGALAPNFYTLAIALGLQGGMTTLTSAYVPTYFMEICPPDIRGRYSVAILLIGGASTIVTALFGLALLPLSTMLLGLAPWRWYIIVVSVVPPALSILMCLYLGLESPRYLLKAGYPEKAQEVLQEIAFRNGLNSNEVVPPLEEFIEFSRVLGAQQHSEESIYQFLRAFFHESYSKWILLIQIALIPAFVGFTNYAFFMIKNVDYIVMFTVSSVVALLPLGLMWYAIDSPKYGRLGLMRVSAVLTALAMLPFILTQDPQITFAFYVIMTIISQPMLVVSSLILPELYATEIRMFATSFSIGVSNLIQIPFYYVVGVALSKSAHWVLPLILMCLFVVNAFAIFMIKADTTGIVLK